MTEAEFRSKARELFKKPPEGPAFLAFMALADTAAEDLGGIMRVKAIAMDELQKLKAEVRAGLTKIEHDALDDEDDDRTVH